MRRGAPGHRRGGGGPGPGRRLGTLADAILADLAADSLHASGRWQRAPDDDRVDAALLLAAIRGAVPATDPRSLATLGAIAADLSSDGYLYRYRHDQRPLQEAEGAFVLCGFLMALATHQLGRTSEAVGWFERNRAACGPPALFTEEFDTHQHQLRGTGAGRGGRVSPPSGIPGTSGASGRCAPQCRAGGSPAG